MGRNHLARDCPSKFRCKTCSKKHHTLLHPGFPGSGSATTPVTDTATLAVAYPPSSSGDSVSGSPDTNSTPPISSNFAMGIANSTPVNIDVGQLVLVQEDNKPSITWPLARIVATHPGRDGIIRVVTIKTAAGTYTRLFPAFC